MQLKNLGDALVGFPCHGCVGLRRRLGEHSEVRRDHLMEMLNWKMVRHTGARLQTHEEEETR